MAGEVVVGVEDLPALRAREALGTRGGGRLQGGRGGGVVVVIPRGGRAQPRGYQARRATQIRGIVPHGDIIIVVLSLGVAGPAVRSPRAVLVPFMEGEVEGISPLGRGGGMGGGRHRGVRGMGMMMLMVHRRSDGGVM